MLKAVGLSKSYGSVHALADVSATFSPGEIHAVLGENGAGKSTLMGILAGFIPPQRGTVELNGTPLPVGRPFECRRRGIAMIHQHFTLVPEFSVLENLALAQIERLAKPLDLPALAQPALALAKELGWPVDPTARTSTLSVGAQQRVEILKYLGNEAQVVIFDEPTAVLAPDEVEDLFRVLRRLRDHGKIVVFIAHKLREVLAVADRITVLRQGRFVATAPRADVDEAQLAEWMVGQLPPALRKSRGSHPRSKGTPGEGEAPSDLPALEGEAPSELGIGRIPGLQVHALTALGDRGEQALQGIDLEIRPGEIVGIGGVDGNGQTELAECLAGVRRPKSGSVIWGIERTRREGAVLSPVSNTTTYDVSPMTGYIPQDRQADGLALGMSIEENMLIEGRTKPSLTNGPFFRPGTIRAWSETLLKRFDIRAGSVTDPASSLSGGNQQKVVVSRVIDQNPDLLIVSNPTRGLDLQAAAFVHQQILDAAANGAAVLLISTDLDELAALADQTFFISAGKLTEAGEAATLVGGGS